jgi:uncharacterized protein YaaW (UPF0174 family)
MSNFEKYLKNEKNNISQLFYAICSNYDNFKILLNNIKKKINEKNEKYLKVKMNDLFTVSNLGSFAVENVAVENVAVEKSNQICSTKIKSIFYNGKILLYL